MGPLRGISCDQSKLIGLSAHLPRVGSIIANMELILNVHVKDVNGRLRCNPDGSTLDFPFDYDASDDISCLHPSCAHSHMHDILAFALMLEVLRILFAARFISDYYSGSFATIIRHIPLDV
jgi:hypothetical protein